MGNNITVVIYSYNEEKNIVSCIESARLLTGNILIVDMGSSDKTVQLAEKMKAKVVTFPFTPYVEPAREFGIRQVADDWVLIIDADERVTRELAQEVEKVTNYLSGRNHKKKKIGGYKIPRKNIFDRWWLSHGGWWPDYQIRLINRKFFISWPKEIHSTPLISERVGILKNPLLHFFHGDFQTMVKKTIVFEDIESDLLFKAGRQAGVATFFRKFLGEFYRRLIKFLGFLDGEVGIIESIYQAFSKTITYIFLYEKKIKGRSL